MEPDPLDLAATPARLRRLAVRGYLDGYGLERALVHNETLPTRAEWERFIDVTLLLLATALTLSGVIFFFAYNWADMHRFAKFGLIQAALLAAVGIAHRWRGTAKGKVALLAASVLVGALLAVFGQAYQTGADSFQLFLAWAVLITGWVIIGQFVPLWLGLLLLINTAVILFWEQRLDWDETLLIEALALGNAVFLGAWEAIRRRSGAWMQAAWFPQLIVLGILAAITGPMIEFIWTDFHDQAMFAAPALYLSLGGALLLYYYMRHDLFVLTMIAFSIIVVVTAGAARLMDDGFSGFILLSLLVIVQAGIAVSILRRQQHRWEQLS